MVLEIELFIDLIIFKIGVWEFNKKVEVYGFFGFGVNKWVLGIMKVNRRERREREGISYILFVMRVGDNEGFN